jgi:hypothetical protein
MALLHAESRALRPKLFQNLEPEEITWCIGISQTVHRKLFMRMQTKHYALPMHIFYTSALQTERRLQRMLPVPDVRLFESLRPTENVFIIFILRSNEMLKKKNIYIYIVYY